MSNTAQVFVALLHYRYDKLGEGDESLLSYHKAMAEESRSMQEAGLIIRPSAVQYGFSIVHNHRKLECLAPAGCLPEVLGRYADVSQEYEQKIMGGAVEIGRNFCDIIDSRLTYPIDDIGKCSGDIFRKAGSWIDSKSFTPDDETDSYCGFVYGKHDPPVTQGLKDYVCNLYSNPDLSSSDSLRQVVRDRLSFHEQRRRSNKEAIRE